MFFGSPSRKCGNFQEAWTADDTHSCMVSCGWVLDCILRYLDQYLISVRVWGIGTFIMLQVSHNLLLYRRNQPHTFLFRFNLLSLRRESQKGSTMCRDPIKSFQTELRDMDCEVVFPRTLSEAEELNSIINHIEHGELWQSDIRKVKEWQIYPWLIMKITECEVKVNLIKDK